MSTTRCTVLILEKKWVSLLTGAFETILSSAKKLNQLKHQISQRYALQGAVQWLLGQDNVALIQLRSQPYKSYHLCHFGE